MSAARRESRCAGSVKSATLRCRVIGIFKSSMPVADPLSKTHPELAAQWHPTRNEGLTPEDVRANSYKKVWWRCAKGHDWKVAVNKRTKSNYGCSYCSGQRTAPEDSLAARFPAIAAEWHPTKNLFGPTDVRPGSNRRVVWICAKQHEWEATVSRRSRGSGCPKCSGHQTRHPLQRPLFCRVL